MMLGTLTNSIRHVKSCQVDASPTDPVREPSPASWRSPASATAPWPATGGLVGTDGPLGQIAERLGATPSQLALAWLLQRSPVMLRIPGTSSVAHLEENVAAADLELSAEDMEAFTDATA